MCRTSHRPFAIVLPIILACIVVSATTAGKFDQIRQSVRTDKPKANNHDDDDDDDDDHDHDWDDDDDDDFNLIEAIFSGLFSSNDRHHHHRNLDHDVHYQLDEYDRAFDQPANRVPEMFFAHYPYAQGRDGYMMHSDFMTALPQTSAIRAEFQFGTDFDDTNRYTGKAIIEGTSRWGLDAEWNHYTERVGPGVKDNLYVGDVNVLFRFVQTPQFLWRLGLGINWFDSGIVDELGLNATTRFEYFPLPPVIFAGEVEYGGLGDSQMFHGAFKLGLNWRHIELFSGYDYRRIAGIGLHGPLFGIRVWW